LSGWPPLDLVTTIIFLSEPNIIANVRIWIDSLHESSRNLSQLSNKTIMSSFEILELEIWAEHWTMSGLQDRFQLLFCCYNLNLKTTVFVNTQEKIYVYIYTKWWLSFRCRFHDRQWRSFRCRFLHRQRRSFRCRFLHRQRRSVCFKKKLINLRSWEGGVKPVLDRPKQG